VLDIHFIRENPDKLRQAAQDKRIAFDLDELLAVDQSLKEKRQELEAHLATRNARSKTLPTLKDPGEKQKLIAEVSALKGEIASLEAEVAPLEARFKELMLLVPQPAREDVPVGKSDLDNVEVNKVGNIPSFDFEIQEHTQFAAKTIDIPRGVKLAGSRSYILRGNAARLEQAVMRFVFDKLVTRNYTPVSVPVLVQYSCMEGTGYFPQGIEQAYLVEKDRLSLIGTSEVALTSLYSGEILNLKDLPIRLMAQSSCFRREAGTYGKDTQGLYRVHQFQKIEQVVICANDESISAKMHDELLTNAEDILTDLELPYRVVYVCTGDLGQGQVRKHDIETWMPSRKSYGETHSCSTFHEFQARRLQLRYKDHDGKTRHCHTLNNTAVASPRILIPLIENHQRSDGRIHIPKVLRPYLNDQSVLEL
jgi:seryl-tRNA synthetase